MRYSAPLPSKQVFPPDTVVYSTWAAKPPVAPAQPSQPQIPSQATRSISASSVNPDNHGVQNHSGGGNLFGSSQASIDHSQHTGNRSEASARRDLTAAQTSAELYGKLTGYQPAPLVAYPASSAGSETVHAKFQSDSRRQSSASQTSSGDSSDGYTVLTTSVHNTSLRTDPNQRSTYSGVLTSASGSEASRAALLPSNYGGLESHGYPQGPGSQSRVPPPRASTSAHPKQQVMKGSKTGNYHVAKDNLSGLPVLVSNWKFRQDSGRFIRIPM